MPPESGSILLLARSVSCTNSSSSLVRPLALGARDVEVAAVDHHVVLDRELLVELSPSAAPRPSGRGSACRRWPGRGRRSEARRRSTGDTHPIIRIVDDLPAPFGPRKPNDSPGATSTSIPSTATNSPNRFTSCRALTSAWPLDEFMRLSTISAWSRQRVGWFRGARIVGALDHLGDGTPSTPLEVKPHQPATNAGHPGQLQRSPQPPSTSPHQNQTRQRRTPHQLQRSPQPPSTSPHQNQTRQRCTPDSCSDHHTLRRYRAR